ncbi:thioredoxin-dependent thiol peroxidase [Shimazuella alba]|uniref:thioredoxin-dependent peroxiredoxin n=1 Tax=Shimazuella alba TaxID=2690964 RepID=A0A6I4W024_9BACL|nr:thioredoxin-dependent thiol peroxidase [Shimazuella alba]MXQ55570.1 thioredoxin-dependent thiol peroxidase [Shimazuella alba]
MINEGDIAPDFTLLSNKGPEVSLSDFRGKNVVLYFYPKDNTPGCTTEACDFRDAHQHFADVNAVILGVSRDNAASHRKFVDKYDLPFLLLSDTEETVCKEYDVLKEKTMFGKTGVGIERSTFIIDGEGKIVKIFRKVKVKDHVAEALSYIKENLT